MNFDSASISNFNISVSGGGHSASITGASGNFLPGSTQSQFEINEGTGSWEIDGNSADHKEAQGSLFGPNGEEIGGVYGMKTFVPSSGPYKSVVGTFAGKKGSSSSP